MIPIFAVVINISPLQVSGFAVGARQCRERERAGVHRRGGSPTVREGGFDATRDALPDGRASAPRPARSRLRYCLLARDEVVLLLPLTDRAEPAGFFRGPAEGRRRGVVGGAGPG